MKQFSPKFTPKLYIEVEQMFYWEKTSIVNFLIAFTTCKHVLN